MRVIMRVVEGPEVGREYVFPAEGESGDEPTNILVGREDVECQAHWRLSPRDPTVSRAHFTLEVRPPNCYVQDNGSLNGVYLRRGQEPERRIQFEALQNGDRLRLGRTIVEFEIHAPMPTQIHRAPPEVQIAPAAPQPEAYPVKSLPPSPPVIAPEPPDPEFYCVRCGQRMGQAPELKPLMQSLDFMCPQCIQIVLEERRLAEERSRERFFCLECGRDVTEMARRDGRAQELKDVALYLCSGCGQRMRQKEQILGYSVLKRLGAGGMGEVYKVWHPETGRIAALKRLLPIAKADERTILRFRREVLIMQDLKHPNIVRLYEVGQEGNSPVFVSEFVPGGNFAQFIDDQGRPLLPPEEVVALIAESLVGLEYLHRRGYVHRDLKPENLLLKPVDGRRIPKIADFGLARSYERHGGTITRTGEYAGTWMYMPPEQITHFKRVRPSVDIYAMGVVVYFLLSGCWPLPDFPTYAQIQQGRVGPLPRTPTQMILHDPRVPLEKRRPDLPRALCQAVNRAIAMRPEDRYQTAEEFRQALLKSINL